MRPEQEKRAEPRGFGTHTRGLSGEYAHEQGWGLDEEERTKLVSGPQDTNGGKDYEYGARDFGDEPLNGDRVVGDKGRKSTSIDAGTTRKEKQ